MHYQRSDISSDAVEPPDALGRGFALERESTMRTMLSGGVTAGIRTLGKLPGHFFLAGTLGFLARYQNQSTVSVTYNGRPVQVIVDLALPFHDLLLQVDSMLGTESGNASGAASKHADVTLHLIAAGQHHGALKHHEGDNVPSVLIRLINGGWELVLDAPEWPEVQGRRNLGYLAHMLESAAQNPQQATGILQLASEADALARYRDLNGTTEPLPEVTVLDLFAEKVKTLGQEDSVRFADAHVSYSQLDKDSTTLAALLQARGADQDHPVAICMQRSEKMPMVLLATLKAGSYFVPLDPSHPKQRLLDVLQECAPAVVMVSPESEGLLADAGLPLMDTSLLLRSESTLAARSEPRMPSANDKAYMIYTSGTTGRPKGVVIQHRALVNFILAMRVRPGLAYGDRLLAVATLSFDMSILDTFLPLCSGATLVIASERAAKDPWELAKIFETQAITCMQATPITWRMLLSSGYKGNKNLKMFVGGEALSRDLAKDLAPLGREIWNCYGPTETTVYSSVLHVEPGVGPVTIGPPMANTVFYIADAAGQLLPPEIAGELYIGGAGVAAGYFERPELNRERFVPDSWTSSREAGTDAPRLFRTGDQIRLTASGKDEFEFFGRLDHQVKLRGYRIELGEIEAVLRAHSSVADAAVLLREDEPGEPWLVGYITPGEANAVPAKELLEFAAQRLPAYMLPSRLVHLPALPLTGSGKVDKRALASLPSPTDVEVKQQGTAASIEGAPLDALETSLLRIFRETLRLKSFGPDDNFFEYGGYSMLAIRLFAKVGTSLHKQLPITALFDAPTVRRLAKLLRSGGRLNALVPIRTTGTEAPFFLVHSYLLYGAASTIVDQARPVYGLRERSASNAALDLQRCVADYAEAIHRAWPAGTVHLGGWCAAATLTVELARRLSSQGREVGMVALFDADAPGFIPLPPTGSHFFAKLNAMRKFHLGRMHGLTFSARLSYFAERLTQAPLNLIERFYTRYHARIDRWQHSFRWLPSAIFYNRFMQVAHLQTEQMEALDTRIQLFRARDVPVIVGSDDGLGWGVIGKRGVEVSFIPGHHESMFLEPNLDVLRDKFQASMRTVEDELANHKQAVHN